MKINFTKNEYRLLLDMLYLADWMLNAHDERPDPGNSAYEMLAQKIFSYAKEMGCDELIEVSKEMNEYFLTRLYEQSSGVHEHIDAYNEDNFWEELISRLTDRDVESKSKVMNRKVKSLEEYWELGKDSADWYAQEFESNGLDRLIIRDG